MKQKSFCTLQMTQAWQTMVALAQSRGAELDLSSLDWELLKGFTVKNNLTPLVNRGIEKTLSREYRNHPRAIELRLLSKMQRFQSQSRMEALGEIVKTFEAKQIPLLAFKGAPLSLELYGDAALRNSCDVDILVPPEKLEEACQCLEALGYASRQTVWDKTPRRQNFYQKHTPQMHKVFYKGGVMVELHWRICYRFEVPFARLWTGRRRFFLMPQYTWQVNTLSEEENLCYLITHGAGHGFRQLRWLLELHTLLEKAGFRLDALYALMKERGVGMLLLETLLLLYRLPGFPMPQTLSIRKGGRTLVEFCKQGQELRACWQREEDRDMARAQKLVRAVYPLLCRNTPQEGLDGKRYKALLPMLGRRKPWCIAMWAPTTEELEWVDLPDRLFGLYFFLRPVHYFVGVLKRVWRQESRAQEKRSTLDKEVSA